MYDLHRPQPPSTVTEEPLLVLGSVCFRTRTDRFGILPADRLRHMYVLGKTGSGKSTLLLQCLSRDLASGQGLALLDPHGDLVEALLLRVPPTRANDLILLRPRDQSVAFSWNPLRRSSGASAADLASVLVAVFRKHWSAFWGPRLEHVLRNAILAVSADEHATLLLLQQFVASATVRDRIVQRVKDPVVRSFWTDEFASYKPALQAEALAPVQNKLGAFVSNPTVRAIVSQERSRLDLATVMERGQVILADLSSAGGGEDASRLLGALLLGSMQVTAMERPRGARPFYIYLDEFQHFVNDSLPTLLAEARKFGVGLVLAHQYLDQLPPSIASAVRGNVGSLLCFRLGAPDAAVLDAEFHPTFTAYDLANQSAYHMVVRLLARGVELRPFTARTLAPEQPEPDASTRAMRIIAQSNERHTKKRADVEAYLTQLLRSGE